MNVKEKDKKIIKKEPEDNVYKDLREAYKGDGPDSLNLSYEMGKQLAKAGKKKKK